MIKDKVLCTICFRSGSKGLKNKNVKLLNNQHLFFWTYDIAKKSKIFKNIIFSIDDKKYIKYLNKYFIKDFFIRKKINSKKNSPKISTIREAMLYAENKNKIKYDYIIDLDVTSPLRNVSDIRKSFNKTKKKKLDNLFSVTNSHKNPYFNMIEIRNSLPNIIFNKKKYVARQNTPKVYDINASIYVWSRKTLIQSEKLINNKTGIFLMPKERSFDIDDIVDFKIVEKFFNKK